MPLPNDEKLIALSEEILKQFEAMFGSHPGFRPGHAKGILLAGRLHRLVRQRRSRGRNTLCRLRLQ